jgi:U3 small nucleolar RNA-associated protein 6
MIDRVQKTLEWMAPELESYKKRQIFSQKQIQKIVENRRRFENKLEKSSRKLIDFLSYIESERNLEKIRNKKIRGKEMGLEETDKLLEANIIKIYQRALHYYSEPVLLKDFSEYCIKRKAIDDMKNTFASKCLKNLTDTDLWVYCSQKLWEIGDTEDARGMFMKGTSINSDSRLCIEFFRFECLYANRLNKMNEEFEITEEDKDDIEKGKIALVIFEKFRERLNKSEIEECIEISSLVPGLKEEMTNKFAL